VLLCDGPSLLQLLLLIMAFWHHVRAPGCGCRCRPGCPASCPWCRAAAPASSGCKV